MAFWWFGPFTFKTRRGERFTFFAAGFGVSLLPWLALEAHRHLTRKPLEPTRLESGEDTPPRLEEDLKDDTGA